MTFKASSVMIKEVGRRMRTKIAPIKMNGQLTNVNLKYFVAFRPHQAVMVQ